MKKVLKIIAMAMGVALMITGVVFLIHSGDHTGAHYGLSRANTNIEFGADFYTTSAQYTALAANAVTDLYSLIKTAVGIFFIFVGATDFCLVLSSCFEKNSNNSDEESMEDSDDEVLPSLEL